MAKMGNSFDTSGKLAAQDEKVLKLVKQALVVSSIVCCTSGILTIFEGTILSFIAKFVFILSGGILFVSFLLGISFGLFTKQSP